MKKNILLCMALGAFALSSCDSFLDKLPDDRAELNTKEKIKNLLVDAYPSNSNVMILEYSSDNVTDNGPRYTAQVSQEELYRFKDVTSEDNDSPRNVWQGLYSAVATANIALEAMDKVNENVNAERGEALLCRAYSMFQLANTFCMAWNPEKADVYLGLPYPTKPETTLNATYERGTLRDLYAKIDADIEEALPLIDDNNYSVPKYHFNKKAAYAFAARFNLYYMKYDKAIDYATKAIGVDPTAVLRNYSELVKLGATDLANRYVESADPANLMFVTAYSAAGRMIMSSYGRFAHNGIMASYETYWASAPWGQGSSNNSLYYKGKLYGTNQQTFFPKMWEFFEFKDKLAQTGYTHIVDQVFTTDETLLVRAEAYALMNDSVNAIKDINYWVTSHCDRWTPQFKVFTIDLVNKFMDGIDYSPVDPERALFRTIKKEFHPQGFVVEPGVQESLLQMILHMRRLETLYQGMRFMDVKRYGISYAHQLTGEESVIFKPGDLRGAIQIPNAVVAAGLQANPRD